MNRLFSSATSPGFLVPHSHSQQPRSEAPDGQRQNESTTFDDALLDELSLSTVGAANSCDDGDAAIDRRRGRRDRTKQPAQHALFTPLHYEARYSYPLLIWLHSDGGSENELRHIMPHVSLRNYVAAAVRGVRSPAIDGSKKGHGGFSWRQGADDVANAAHQVRQCIQMAKRRYTIHPRRIFLAGYEAGGTMALRIGLAYPEWFAGAASLEGPMPQGNCPLSRVKSARRLPLLIASCRSSELYAPEKVSDDLRLLHVAGFSLALRQYPGEHELTTEMLADLDRWIMEQFCTAAVK